MRASSMSMKNPGAPRVRSKGFWMSRRAIVSDSPHEIDCRPIRKNTRPFA
jgi:hypothetical protein